MDAVIKWMKSEEIKEQIERLYNNRSLSRFWINIKNGNAVKNFNYQRWQRFIKLYLFSIVSCRDATCGIVVNPRVVSERNSPRLTNRDTLFRSEVPNEAGSCSRSSARRKLSRPWNIQIRSIFPPICTVAHETVIFLAREYSKLCAQTAVWSISHEITPFRHIHLDIFTLEKKREIRTERIFLIERSLVSLKDKVLMM